MKADKRLIANQFEHILNCVTCQAACTDKHLSREKEHRFNLCEHCTKAMEVMKAEWSKEPVIDQDKTKVSYENQ